MTSDSSIAGPRQRDILDRLWRASSGAAAASVLILLVVLTLALAAVFPQLPAGLAGAAEEHWLAEAAGGYGTLGPVLRSLGAFNLLNSAWFRLLLALASYHLLLRLAGEVRATWSALHGRASHPPQPPSVPARTFIVAGPLEPTLERIAEALKRAYPVRAATSAAGRACIYLERSRLSSLGPLLVYLGALSVLLGLLLNDAAGWRITGLTLAPGGSIEASQSSNLQINLLQITGNGSSAVSELLVARADGSRTGYASYTRPFNWRNVWIAQRTIGPALAVNARDKAGRPVLLERGIGGRRSGEGVNLPFTPSETEQAFADPAQNIAFRVVSYSALPERGYRGPVFLIEAYRGDDPAKPVMTSFVENEANLSVGDATYSLRRDRYAVLEAAYTPGLPVMAPGGLVLLAGVALTLWRGTARAWLDLVEQDGAVQIEARGIGPRGEDIELEGLAQALQGAEERSAA